MKMGFLLLCLSVFTAGAATHASIVEIPLPQLHGSYTMEGVHSRTASVVLDPAPTIVRAVWIRLCGTATVEDYICQDDPYPYRQPVGFESIIASPPQTGFWSAGVASSLEGGPFENTDQFKGHGGTPTWDYLIEGTATVSLFASLAPIIDTCWPVAQYSEGEIGEATLIIDGDFPVPAEDQTWGRIKALYVAP
jgi:hypothetical protein